jgi:hypothetical protein
MAELAEKDPIIERLKGISEDKRKILLFKQSRDLNQTGLLEQLEILNNIIKFLRKEI